MDKRMIGFFGMKKKSIKDVEMKLEINGDILEKKNGK